MSKVLQGVPRSRAVGGGGGGRLGGGGGGGGGVSRVRYPGPQGGTPNNGKLLSNEEIVLKLDLEDTIADISRGDKSNLRFIVNNTQNVMH